MKISNSLMGINTSFYNSLAQGQSMMQANRLSNSKFLFPENKAPGSGSVSSDTVSYISDLKSASSDLSSALRSLQGSAFNQRGMVSSNTDALSVSYTGSSASLGNMSDIKVKIDQVAAGQLNEGNSLKSASNYSGNTGTNRFAIEMGGKTTNLSINVSSTDTNADVQQKMATAINNSGTGLKASVVTDEKTKESVLKIEQQATGSDAKNAFTIKDVTGNAVAATGANNMTSAGQDAIYSVNGGAQQTSKTNNINLGNGVNATLKAASDSEVTISRGTDSSAAVSAVNNMVNSYNKLFEAAASNTGDPKAQNLASRLMNVSSVYSKQLSDVGIGFNSEGKMTIDSAKLNKAAEDGSLESLFTQDRGRNYGFTNQLGRLADNVKNNTAAFIANPMFGAPSDIFGGYSGKGSMAQINAAGIGSLLDFSF